MLLEHEHSSCHNKFQQSSRSLTSATEAKSNPIARHAARGETEPRNAGNQHRRPRHRYNPRDRLYCRIDLERLSCRDFGQRDSDVVCRITTMHSSAFTIVTGNEAQVEYENHGRSYSRALSTSLSSSDSSPRPPTSPISQSAVVCDRTDRNCWVLETKGQFKV